MSTDNTLNLIYRYQKKLEKYAAHGENEKLLYCIHKLKYLPVTVKHLEITGVGKSINSLRHEKGDVREKAKVLVTKWKQMVEEEEQRQEIIRKQQEEEELLNKVDKHRQEESHESEREDSDENDCLHIEEKVDEYVPLGKSIKVEENGYDPKTSREDYMSVGNSSYQPAYVPTSSSQKYSPSQIENKYVPNGEIKKEDEKHKKKHHKSKSGSRESKHQNNTSSSSSSSSHKRKREKSDSRSKPDSKDKIKREKDKDRKRSKHKSDSISMESLRDTSNHSNSLSDLESSSYPKKPKSEKSSTSSSSLKKSSDRGDVTSSKSDKENKSSGSKSKKSEQSSSGFEAALMGMDVGTPNKKKKKKKDKEPKPQSTKNKSNEFSPHKTPKVLSVPVPYNAVSAPVLPDLSDESDGYEEPKLMADYKPLPHVPQRNVVNETYHSRMTDEEALGMMLASKNHTKSRKIYTGKASFGMTVVPSLFESCIKVLQENINVIETFGGIPYDILKPILDKATPQQLFALEDYNPYLLEDTDELWAAHSRKSFKNKTREEMETWRDMYIRCTDEHHEKMRTVTENLHKKYSTDVPAKRTTQMAFINTVAKPPKSVARAQAKYGTGAASSSRPMNARGDDSSSASTFTPKYANNQHTKPERVPVPSRPPAAKKPKVAPLMAKSRQLMKKVCRR